MFEIDLPGNLRVTSADNTDIQAISRLIVASEIQKQHPLDKSPEKIIWKDHKGTLNYVAYHTKIDMKYGDQYFLLSSLPDKANWPSIKSRGRQLCGIASVDTSYSRCLYVSKLNTILPGNAGIPYTEKKKYYGTTLLNMLVSMAKAKDLPALELFASNYQVAEWYVNRAKMLYKTSVETINTTSRDMILPKSRYSMALNNLEDITGFSLDNCLIFKNSLDSMTLIP